MAAEATAVVDGIRSVAPDPDITIVDPHGRMRTVLFDELLPDITLVRGRNRSNGMADGVDPEHDLTMFVGYHDRPGTG